MTEGDDRLIDAIEKIGNALEAEARLHAYELQLHGNRPKPDHLEAIFDRCFPEGQDTGRQGGKN